ncbi:hypothetical protein VN97_g11709, partial [Penicillium thymicola]
PPP